MEKLTHPRDWQAVRVQGRLCWIVSVSQDQGYLVFRKVGWR